MKSGEPLDEAKARLGAKTKSFLLGVASLEGGLDLSMFNTTRVDITSGCWDGLEKT